MKEIFNRRLCYLPFLIHLALSTLYLKFSMILMVQLCQRKMRNPGRYEDIFKAQHLFSLISVFIRKTFSSQFFLLISLVSDFIWTPKVSLGGLRHKTICCYLLWVVKNKNSWLLTSPPCVQMFFCMQICNVIRQHCNFIRQ